MTQRSQGQRTHRRKIPGLRPIDWETIFSVSIEEIGEPLVPVSLYPERILARSTYYLQKYEYALPEVYLREGVYERLVEAADSLPNGYRLVVFDGWRPVPLQRALHEDYVRELAERFPDKEEEELRDYASRYVALPSTDPERPSPHSTGGAVDLTIADEKGRLVYMGGDFDEKSERSYTRYYEDKVETLWAGSDTPQEGSELSPDMREALENRRLLYTTMIEAGFSNYSAEWWHYDYGNQNWIYFSGGNVEKVRYGITEIRFS